MIIKDSDRETHLERWLEIRRGGLTATEAGAIAAGKRTIGSVWADKKSGKKVPSNPFMEWGNMMEPRILDWLRMELDNQTIVANSHIVAWDDDQRCLATPDGFTHGAVVECKTTGADWDGLVVADPLCADVFRELGILHYFYQCQWQMLICDVDECFFAWNVRETAPFVEQKGMTFSVDGEPVRDPNLIFIPGEFHCVLVERDVEAVEKLLQVRDDFFAYEESDGPSIPAEAVELMRESNRLKARAEMLRKRALELVEPVLNAGDRVSGEWGSVSCSERRVSRLDSKALAADLPDVFDKYSSESVSTQIRFVLKEED
nr:MAG TPA: Exonuclease [Caudoviricetes sp.]